MTHPRIWIQQDESKQDGHAPDSKDAKSAAHAEEHAADEHAADEHSADPMDHYLDPKHMIEHVQDTNYFELPAFLRFEFSDDKIIKIPIPFAATKETKPVIAVPENEYISPVYLRPTKFMILEVVAAVIIFVLFTYLARQIKNGDRPKGKLANMLESLVVFIRDEVARPAIGKKDADRYLPFIWTIFFFILTLNLFGMIPLMGTATGALGCTIALALITFAIVLGSGMKRLGVVGFWKAQAPHMDLPAPMKLTLVPVIWD